jgi:hypothetical protein
MADQRLENTKCDWGDHPAERIWNGAPICWRHWYWVKLDSPAADYWIERVDNLFEQGPDAYDYKQWETWGIAEEVTQALNTLKRLKALHVRNKEAGWMVTDEKEGGETNG